jgi:hypothetical protein
MAGKRPHSDGRDSGSRAAICSRRPSDSGVIVRHAHRSNRIAHTPACFAGQFLVLLILIVSFGAASTPSYGATPVTDYNCPNDNSNNGHYVPANRYWEEEFTAQGSAITGGYLLLGATIGDHDHTARIGIYTGADRSGALEEIYPEVVGFGGVSFTFPMPIAVSPGEHLHIAATGVGDFVAYDEVTNGADGCLIGRLEGYASTVSESPSTHGEPPAPPQETQPPPSEGPQTPPSRGNPAVAHFSRRNAVAWANEHVGDHEFFSEDCTDFVSKDWTHGGGLSQQSWWYLDEWVPRKSDILGFTYSNTWAAAENFANEMAARQWVRRSSITNMGAKIIPGAEPGDVVLWHDHDGSKTFWSHVALVMGVVRGATVIDQHTPRYVHHPWNQRWLSASPADKRILHAQLLHLET